MQLVPLFSGSRCPEGQSWRERNAHLFPTNTSLRWFKRVHERRLVAAGALVDLRDTWHAAEPVMTQEVLAIAREQAERLISPPKLPGEGATDAL